MWVIWWIQQTIYFFLKFPSYCYYKVSCSYGEEYHVSRAAISIKFNSFILIGYEYFQILCVEILKNLFESSVHNFTPLLLFLIPSCRHLVAFNIALFLSMHISCKHEKGYSIRLACNYNLIAENIVINSLVIWKTYWSKLVCIECDTMGTKVLSIRYVWPEVCFLWKCTLWMVDFIKPLTQNENNRNGVKQVPRQDDFR